MVWTLWIGKNSEEIVIVEPLKEIDDVEADLRKMDRRVGREENES